MRKIAVCYKSYRTDVLDKQGLSPLLKSKIYLKFFRPSNCAQIKFGCFQSHQVFIPLSGIQQRKRIQIAHLYSSLKMQIGQLLLFQLSSHLIDLYLIFTENNDCSVC